MAKRRINAELRSLIEPFASDLAELVAKAVLRSIEQALAPATSPTPKPLSSPARDELIPVPRRGLPGPVRSDEPLSLEHYERLAIQRAIADAEGNVIAAARTLALGKSTMYRRMHALGIPISRQGEPVAFAKSDAVLTSKGSVSLKSYERIAVDRALYEAGGSILAAAKLLQISKSNMYRLVDEHALKGGRGPASPGPARGSDQGIPQP